MLLSIGFKSGKFWGHSLGGINSGEDIVISEGGSKGLLRGNVYSRPTKTFPHSQINVYVRKSQVCGTVRCLYTLNTSSVFNTDCVFSIV